MKALTKLKPYGFIGYILLMVFVTLVFQNNLINTASEFQFRTWRDGSEALVLGKILADSKGISTGRANLGFIEKDELTKGSNVLAVYKYLDNPDGLIAEDVNDQNWVHGIATFDTIILFRRVNVAEQGYADNEVKIGDRLYFDSGDIRSVTRIELVTDYLYVHYSGKILNGHKVGFPNRIKLSGDLDNLRFKFDPYDNQYGAQGVMFSWIYKNLGSPSVWSLQLICASLLAVVIVLLSREYKFSISNFFGFVFMISMIGSPWIVSIARNLYWTTFLWFLPALIAMWLYRKQKKSLYLIFLLSIFLKCLDGYEYLSTIVIFSVAIFIIDPFSPSPRYGIAKASKIIMLLGALSILGFVLALFLHSTIRAENLVQGLMITIKQDALKYSDFSDAAGTISRGIEMPIKDVLMKYIFEWNAPMFFGIINQHSFIIILALTVLSLIYQYYIVDAARHRDTVLIVIMTLAPLSWFVLMKGHSVIHVHLNYVLWYIGCVPAAIFVGGRGCALFCISSIKRFHQ